MAGLMGRMLGMFDVRRPLLTRLAHILLTINHNRYSMLVICEAKRASVEILAFGWCKTRAVRVRQELERLKLDC